MTKTVRIENADNSTFKPVLRVQHKNADGVWEDQPELFNIDYPTAMVTTYLTSHRRIVIEEAPQT